MRLSVIMSVYNGERWLQEAIDSVVNQLKENDNFLIRDDGSTDGTQSILRDLQSPSVKIFEGKNIGLTASLNILLEKAQGKYIARMDADDLSLQNRFESQINELEERKLDLISSAPYLFDQKSQQELKIQGFFDENRLERFNGFTHGSWLFRRELIDQGYRYNTDFLTAQDYEFLLRLKAAGFSLGVSQEVTYHRRHHPMTVTQRLAANQKNNMLRAQYHYWQLLDSDSRSLPEKAIASFRLGHFGLFLKHLGQLVFMGRWTDVKYVLKEVWFYYRHKSVQ